MKMTLTRRSFLKSATIAGSAVLAGCATTRGKRTPANDRVVMAGIGMGWMGLANLDEFLKRKDVQVVAVCDVDKNHLAEGQNMVNTAYGNKDCVTYEKFEDLFARKDLDAVMIALPDHWHAIPAIAAANAGLDVYGEKPLSHSLMEGRAMCDAIKKNKRIWQTGSWQRSVKDFRRAAELVRNGRLGKVKYVEVGLGGGHTDYTKLGDQTTPCAPPAELNWDRWQGPAATREYCPAIVHKNWRWVMAYGGGTLMDWVGHHLDIAHWGLGLDHTGPVSVDGTGVIPTTGVWDSPPEYDCTCTYADGLVIKISNKYPMGCKWVGDKGWLFVTRGEIQADPISIRKEKIGDNETRLYASDDHYENFIECVKSRKETITPCETAHRSASVGHLCNIAIYTGRKIKWDPEKEKIVGDDEASKMLYPNYRAPWKLG